MSNFDEETEWNDILRSKGIIPPKQAKEAEISEDQIVNLLEQTIEAKTTEDRKSAITLDEIDELEDSEDEAVFLEIRNKRIAELRLKALKPQFGDIREISGQDYVDEVTRAGSEIWVVLHLYAKGNILCALINQYMTNLAKKFPHTKFLKSIAQTCIPNFPEQNVPCIFIYYEGQLKKQIIGASELRGESLTEREFEYLLGKEDAILTDIKEDPRKTNIRDKMFNDLSDVNDW